MKKFAIAIALILLPVHFYPTDSDAKIDEKISEIIDSINEETLLFYENILASFGPHPTGSETCDMVADFIFNEFEKEGLKVEYQYWEKNGISGKNVIATLQGKTDFILIISAHYDTVEVSPGADDDSSGVAVVLTSAKILSKYSFLHTIKFVAFSGEEQGLYGSEYFARNSYKRGEKIIGDIQLDGVGYAVKEDRKVRISSNSASKWIVDMAEQIALDYKSKIDLEISRHDYMGSDHKSFYNYGYEGVFFLEYEFNPNYHTSEDTIEHININYLTKICKLASATLAKIADESIDIMTRIVEPEIGGIYFSGRKIIELDGHLTILIGKIKVRAEIISSKEVQRVDFYFDNRFYGTVYEKPYEFTYKIFAFLNHKLRAVGYIEGKSDDNEISIICFI
ncbi:MAG: M28 family peptidase [Thermoplasmatales archaeon]|nr:M28 family peptidase [Thermoplasmatales archaeon]